MNFIEIHNVSKYFSEVPVLKNLNIDVEESSVLGILGRSGAGKSVLINMLRGMQDYKPDQGKIYYNVALCPDCRIVDGPSKAGSKCGDCGCELEPLRVDFWNCDRLLFAAIKRRISIMLQRTFALYEDDTVIENVMKGI
ncbi:MAG TPA: ATP-binding cassette domain-containing protein, partial [Methanobacterium sp.]|nr:ATP-binding cassette domain-containing protein [Methanobacterium sp.]